MTSTQRLFEPLSLGLATTLTGLTGVAAVVAGIASITASWDLFGFGVGTMLLIYGAIIMGIVWSAVRRRSWSWGLLVAVSLLNAFAVGSFLETDQWSQRIVIGLALIIIVAAGVAAVMPSTRRALLGD